jgi:hypothetical protein
MYFFLATVSREEFPITPGRRINVMGGPGSLEGVLGKEYYLKRALWEAFERWRR